MIGVIDPVRHQPADHGLCRHGCFGNGQIGKGQRGSHGFIAEIGCGDDDLRRRGVGALFEGRRCAAVVVQHNGSGIERAPVAHQRNLARVGCGHRGRAIRRQRRGNGVPVLVAQCDRHQPTGVPLDGERDPRCQGSERSIDVIGERVSAGVGSIRMGCAPAVVVGVDANAGIVAQFIRRNRAEGVIPHPVDRIAAGIDGEVDGVGLRIVDDIVQEAVDHVGGLVCVNSPPVPTAAAVVVDIVIFDTCCRLRNKRDGPAQLSGRQHRLVNHISGDDIVSANFEPNTGASTGINGIAGNNRVVTGLKSNPIDATIMNVVVANDVVITTVGREPQKCNAVTRTLIHHVAGNRILAGFVQDDPIGTTVERIIFDGGKIGITADSPCIRFATAIEAEQVVPDMDIVLVVDLDACLRIFDERILDAITPIILIEDDADPVTRLGRTVGGRESNRSIRSTYRLKVAQNL